MKKKWSISIKLILPLLIITSVNAQISINDDGSLPDNSSILDIKSNTKGVLVSRMTSAERSIIGSPATGLIIFQTDDPSGFYYYDGESWQIILSRGDGFIGNAIDIDGNGYRTVKIGNQEWMTENLKVTHYCNGDAIIPVTEQALWSSMTIGAYCWYDNDEILNKNKYGSLYNYYAIIDERNICPTGWHVPTNDEFSTLKSYLGGESIAGGKMKSALYWTTPNTGSTNSCLFSAYPGGYRQYTGSFIGIGDSGLWWSSTEFDIVNAWRITLNFNSQNFFQLYDFKAQGCSVRCIKY